MRIKLTHIIIALVILGVLFVFGWKAGFTMQSGQSVEKEYSTIQGLMDATDFDFLVPNNVASDTLISARNIMGSMVEIETVNYLFRAAPFIAYNVEPSGNYDKTSIDNRYINDDETLYARYRSEGNKTLITLKIDDTAYSIIYNTYVDEQEAFANLGINKEEMKEFEYTPDADKNDSQDSQVGADKDDLNTIDSDSLSFRLFESSDMGVQFMVPETNREIRTIYTGNSLAVLLDKEVAFTIEYYKPNEDGTNTYNLSDFSTGCIELGNGYLLRYVPTTNNILIDNIDTIASTFKVKEQS